MNQNQPPISTSAFHSRTPPPPPPLPCHSMNIISSNKVKATNIDSLPKQLLLEILARLPAEFLHHVSRFVCRNWQSIIQSDAFANRQLQLSQHSAYGLLLSSGRHSIYSTATQGRFETYEDWSDMDIICCCNGLALKLHVNRNGETLRNSLHVSVTNPLTKKSFPLPSFSVDQNTSLYQEKCGIGYSAASMKYKVTLPYFKLVEGCHMLLCLAILTVGVDQSWRHVELPDPRRHFVRLLLCSPLTTEGFLHWECPDGCLTLNVDTEIFTKSEIPVYPRWHHNNHYKFYYLSTGRYLSLLVGLVGELCWDVWEMQSGGEFIKLEYKIDLESERKRLQQFTTENCHNEYLLPVGWVKYPEIMAFLFRGLRWHNCIFYNIKTHEINTIEIKDQHRLRRGDYNAFVHRNSLLYIV